ncbi:O-methyltransferase family 3 protein [Fomitiporia mediterranea MF3/22]|uniref:O-methyltransferase family 3 protein n=1 Tax=Fomitiporia mediterranea (strain MF3/22) TaxID=694068 RepID=R7SG56_FOMME|nr:O-methyltransferase family 3 protein [Fomitiporia mediterranea MF3/22]EJC97698.1 O-methyltransferase family 3 protein [Fomitiporia mediterranea MF3/22]
MSSSMHLTTEEWARIVSNTRLTTEDFAKSDDYFNSYLNPKDPVLEAGVQNSRANGLPDIAVSSAQGKLLKLIAQSISAKRILEIGVLGGYSTTWLARALPEDGKLIGLELSDKHARVAKENISRAGLLSKVEVKVGPAADTLKTLKSSEPFDLVFIDADWENIPVYFNEANIRKKLARKGGVILLDNVNWLGRAALELEDTKDEWVKAIRKLLEQLKDDKEVDATVFGLVGVRDFDGMLYAVKL